MKIAASSANFSPALGATLTQLEWLDICANELELDGVVFDTRDFPRDDAEYLAQLKKLAVDLGLTIAALEVADVPADERHLTMAAALGAPLLIFRAPEHRPDAAAWGEFVAATRSTVAQAKHYNVTLALRAFSGTLCEDADACKRLAKDVDSAWLRFTVTPVGAGGRDASASLLARSVIATHTIRDIANFAISNDDEAAGLIAAFERFRGFVVLEHSGDAAGRDAYHHAVTRFAGLRARALTRV